MRVIEIGGHGDDGFRNLLAEPGFSIGFQFLENHGTHFLRAEVLIPHLDQNAAIGRGFYFKRHSTFVLLDGRVGKGVADEALDAENSVFGIGNRLALGEQAHQTLAGL